jgi:hypothetical protein
VRIVPASRIEIIANEEAQLARLRDPTFDPEHSVILSAQPGAAGPEKTSFPGDSSVTWQKELRTLSS